MSGKISTYKKDSKKLIFSYLAEATKIDLAKYKLVTLMWYGVIPKNIFQHENLSYKKLHDMKISTSRVLF